MILQTLLPVIFVIGSLNQGVTGQSLICPAVRTTSGWLDLFPLPCRKNSECKVMSKQHLCCKGVCTKGIQGAAAIKSTTRQSIEPSVAFTDSSTSTTTSTTTTTTTTPSTTTTSSTTPSTTTTSSTTPSTTTTSSTTPSTTTTSSTTPSTTTTSTTTTTTTPSTTTSSTTTTTTTTPKPTTTESPLQPFLQLLPIQRSVSTTPKATSGKSQKLVCPKPGQSAFVLFPIPCEKNSQCRSSSGPDQVCCENRCVKGVPAPKPTRKPKSHQPLLGVIPRECPAAPLGELLFEVQTCKTDADCWPRICCPDGTRSYCRTARARLDLVPVANAIDGPVRMVEQYLQCTPPPQYDVFPQKCSSSVDCFPNLCCAEGGQKHCRPPQRSLLALLAGRFGGAVGNLRQATGGNTL